MNRLRRSAWTVVPALLAVGAVAAARPDLVHLLRGTAKPLELRDSPVKGSAA